MVHLSLTENAEDRMWNVAHSFLSGFKYSASLKHWTTLTPRSSKGSYVFIH